MGGDSLPPPLAAAGGTVWRSRPVVGRRHPHGHASPDRPTPACRLRMARKVDPTRLIHVLVGLWGR